jgi:hypothetical protein
MGRTAKRWIQINAERERLLRVGPALILWQGKQRPLLRCDDGVFAPAANVSFPPDL